MRASLCVPCVCRGKYVYKVCQRQYVCVFCAWRWENILLSHCKATPHGGQAARSRRGGSGDGAGTVRGVGGCLGRAELRVESRHRLRIGSSTFSLINATLWRQMSGRLMRRAEGRARYKMGWNWGDHNL